MELKLKLYRLAVLITALLVSTNVGTSSALAATSSNVGTSSALAATSYEINWWTVDGCGSHRQR